jgi:glycosyltransferase involved in cell wall biosynthesis
VTSSEHEAQRIRENNARVRRVEPIGLSVASALVDSTPVAPEIASGLDGFTLTVGRLNVRKNLRAVLLGALESGRLTPARPLIVVGSEEGRSAELPAEAAQATRDGLVRFVPHVTDGELSWLYAHADVFVYLALDEGFGLPPVEALHFGTPVVVSDIAVFHENLGSFATYVDPQDTSAVARTLREISEDRVDASPVLRSWASCAQRLRSAIERARS